MKKRSKKKNSLASAKTESAPKISKSHAVTLAALLIWSALCVGFYYFSIKAQLLWPVHLYVWLGLPTLCAAVVINAYFNAKYAGAEKKPAPELIAKVKFLVKALMIIGLPPIACVIIEFTAGRIIEKFFTF